MDGGRAWKPSSWLDVWKLGSWPVSDPGPVWKCGAWAQTSWQTPAWRGWALCVASIVVAPLAEHLWRGARLRARRR